MPRAEWERLPREIKAFEPPGALLGGEDGLDLIRPLIRQAQQYVIGGGWVLLEVGDQQAPQVAALLAETGAYNRIETIKDFSGMERVVRARRRDGSRLKSLYTLQHDAHFIIAVFSVIGVARMGIVTCPSLPRRPA